MTKLSLNSAIYSETHSIRFWADFFFKETSFQCASIGNFVTFFNKTKNVSLCTQLFFPKFHVLHKLAFCKLFCKCQVIYFRNKVFIYRSGKWKLFFISCYFWNSREFHVTFLEVCFAKAQTHKILGIHLSFWSPDFGIGSPDYSQDVFLVAIIFATNKSLFCFCSFFCSSKLQIFWINCYSNSLSLAHAARGFSTRFFSLSQIVCNLY